MQLIYENELGRIILGGGKNDSINITEIQGLSFPETYANTVKYSGVPGQTVVSVSILPRTITVSGDIKDKTGILAQKIATVLSKEGTLYVVSERRKRKIDARCTSFIPEKKKRIFIPFSAQFVCDSPYFEDSNETRESVFKKVNLTKSEFVLPYMFSKRNTEARVINRGTYVNEPVFEITVSDYASCPNGIVIDNHTTEKSIKLLCDVLKDECITVDIRKRKVWSNLRGNLLSKLSDESILSDMGLAVGINNISVLAEDEPGFLHVVCKYTNSYVEALI